MSVRALFVTFPWRTHFQFCVPMAWALRTAGHEVHFAGSPELTDVITEAGLTAVPVGPDEPFAERVRRARQEGESFDTGPLESGTGMLSWDYLRMLARHSAGLARLANHAIIDDLVAYCRWWKPDLVVWEYLSHAGPVAAAAVGAAHARFPIGIELDTQIRRHFLAMRARQDPARREDPMREWLGAWGEAYGFAFSEELTTGQFAIDHLPDSMRLEREVPHVSVRYVPYNGRAVAPDWVRREPRAPRVLATFGMSMWNAAPSLPVVDSQRVSGEQLQDMLDSLADLDIELVMTLPASVQERLRRVPENTRLVEFVPLHVVIPSCSAVIHHGGLPAFCDALAQGIPQLMLTTMTPDAVLRGAHLLQAGAGRWLSPERVTGKTIRDCVVSMLQDPALREGAARLRREVMAQPPPNEAVSQVERLVAERRA